MYSLINIVEERIAPGTVNGIRLKAKHYDKVRTWLNWDSKTYGASKYHETDPMIPTTMWGHHEMIEQAWGLN